MNAVAVIAKTLHEEVDFSHPDSGSADVCDICVENAKRIMAALSTEFRHRGRMKMEKDERKSEPEQGVDRFEGWVRQGSQEAREEAEKFLSSLPPITDIEICM